MNLSQTTDFLKSVRLFQDLDDTQRYTLAQEFNSIALKDGEELYQEGKPGGDFYIITSGKIHLARWENETELSIGDMKAGEFLGHESFLDDSNHIATARAIGNCTLLTADRNLFGWILDQHPEIEEELKFLARSYKISRRSGFGWLGKDEVVHAVAQKHFYVLFVNLLPIIILAAVSFAFVLSSLVTNNKLVSVSGLIFMGVMLLVALWIWLDWGNDYYVVTDQRVVWMEKIVMLYESRHTAPLDAILSINVDTSFAQRLFGSGDVVINTFTGKTTLKNVDQPKRLEKIIQDYWQRSQQQGEQDEYHTRVSLMREELAIEAPIAVEDEIQPVDIKKTNKFTQNLINLLKTQYRENGAIIYRKHIFILLRRTWVHLSVLTLTSVGFFMGSYQYFSTNNFSGGLLALISFTVGVLFVLVLLYHIVDWGNDIYKVTDRHIFDIDRSPFGHESSKSAPLERILNTSVEQSFLKRLLRFGTVVINVGETKFTFDDVYNPSKVQQEIFSRYYARKEQIKQQDASNERQRMLGWISVYHEQTGNQNNSGDEPDFY